MTIMSNSEQTENTKNAEKQTRFPKEQVENTDLYEPVLNKIMRTQEQFIKQDFLAPLKHISIQCKSHD